jgi:hypothetical protein
MRECQRREPGVVEAVSHADSEVTAAADKN